MREFTTPEAVHVLAENWPALARMRGELLDELCARAQYLEATLILTEDQRDKALKERDDWLAALKREQAKHLETLSAAIAERDALRKQLDELRSDYADRSYWGKE